MSALTSVEALPGVGLAGDRYSEAKNRRSPDYEVTLIELENIEGFTKATGRELTPEMPRRNIVTTEVLAIFRGKGGLRARIVSGGIVSVGDAVNRISEGGRER